MQDDDVQDDDVQRADTRPHPEPAPEPAAALQAHEEEEQGQQQADAEDAGVLDTDIVDPLEPALHWEAGPGSPHHERRNTDADNEDWEHEGEDAGAAEPQASPTRHDASSSSGSNGGSSPRVPSQPARAEAPAGSAASPACTSEPAPARRALNVAAIESPEPGARSSTGRMEAADLQRQLEQVRWGGGGAVWLAPPRGGGPRGRGGGGGPWARPAGAGGGGGGGPCLAGPAAPPCTLAPTASCPPALLGVQPPCPRPAPQQPTTRRLHATGLLTPGAALAGH